MFKGRRQANAKPKFWTPQDHAKFLQGIEKFGLEESLGPDGADLMALFMVDRTRVQIRSHAQKYYAENAKEKNAAKRGGRASGTQRPDGSCGGM